MPRAPFVFAKIATVLSGVITQTRFKKPSLSYYHCVVNAAHYLSSCHVVIPPIYHQFSPFPLSSIIYPIKQSHNVIYLEATNLLVTRKPIPSFL